MPNPTLNIRDTQSPLLIFHRNDSPHIPKIDPFVTNSRSTKHTSFFFANQHTYPRGNSPSIGLLCWCNASCKTIAICLGLEYLHASHQDFVLLNEENVRVGLVQITQQCICIGEIASVHRTFNTLAFPAAKSVVSCNLRRHPE